ncbi:hypothetical protein PuT2_14015 [Pusillimonas sp. T2]|uniref:hypothetical protein n=1 Tax=Pusillimonas sp. T2 TaxID=1548123 RepID=UPI000B9CADE9|nr:hypothetical protein [Pusillimonas sp. T2]OXR48135.1 hypothetical protein PuT2_14015 [Pusillimonas sp. T2]
MTEPIKLPPEFRSGNSIPVERATITRERMVEILTEAIEAGRAALQSPEVKALRDALWVSTEHNALHFGESSNTVIQGCAALAQGQGGSDA